MMGLDVKRTKLKAYVLCSLLCSIGGICYCLNTMMASNHPGHRHGDGRASPPPSSRHAAHRRRGNVIGTLFGGVLINGTISTIVLTNGKLASSWPNILTPCCCASSSCCRASSPGSRKRTSKEGAF